MESRPLYQRCRPSGRESTTSQAEPHAFITSPGGMGMKDIGTLGGNSSCA
ncbi:hypothetical protein [Nitrosovibrio sp. Nv6]